NEPASQLQSPRPSLPLDGVLHIRPFSLPNPPHLPRTNHHRLYGSHTRRRRRPLPRKTPPLHPRNSIRRRRRQPRHARSPSPPRRPPCRPRPHPSSRRPHIPPTESSLPPHRHPLLSRLPHHQ